ncbi:MAG TPA: RDD family protein [Gaiellaceae bacterium]|jgi:uncharacterized RDD family membrane protein YckC|nr:RDD family protein [Gaiellaceae bacterium]
MYAGFWRRLGALLIDALVGGAAGFVVGFVIGFAIAISGGDDLSEGWSAAINILSVVGWILYFAIMESSSHQATVGKIALGIQVTDLAGNRLSFGRALGRNLAKLISTIILYIGFIIAAFTERKQALHDMIAGTLVVKRGVQPATQPEPLEASA